MTERRIITADEGVETYCERCGVVFYRLEHRTNTVCCIECAKIKTLEQQRESEARRHSAKVQGETWGNRSLTLTYDPAPEEIAYRPGSIHSRNNVVDECRLGYWQDGARFTDKDGVNWIISGGQLVSAESIQRRVIRMMQSTFTNKGEA